MASVSVHWDDQTPASEISLWDTQSGELLKSWPVPSSVSVLSYSPDGHTLAANGEKNTVSLWDVPQGILKRLLTAHTCAVQSVAFSPDGKTLASGSMRIGGRNLVGELYLWDLATGTRREIIMNDAGYVGALSFSADGKLLAAPLSQFVPGIWDTSTLELRRSFKSSL